MIRGKKNFLPPHPLVMGFAFLFKLVRHLGYALDLHSVFTLSRGIFLFECHSFRAQDVVHSYDMR